MSYISSIPLRQARFLIPGAAWRTIFIGVLGFAALLARVSPIDAGEFLARVSPIDAEGLQSPCSGMLEQLSAEWNANLLEMPSKPNQMVVHLRNGHVSSGPEVTYIFNQIRQAAWDCQHDNVQGARLHVALVNQKLHQW